MNKLRNPPSKMTREPYDELFNLSEIANFAENEYDMYLRRQKERDDDYSRYVTAYSEGIEKNKLETARRMKGKSYLLAEICELTGLDKETVEGL